MTGIISAFIVGTLASLFLRPWMRAMTNNRLDDPVYKKNVQALIERNRKFEEDKE